MEQPDDPLPGMLFSEALRVLEERYGVENIEHDASNGEMVIYLAEREGTEVLWPYTFTDRQAKYLALHPILNEDIRRNSFPHDWPTRTDTASGR